MKIYFAMGLACILLISGCANHSQNKKDTQVELALLPTSSVHNYRCESGEMITAVYPSTESAVIQYKGRGYKMQISVSASGSRYLGAGLEWWTKGSGRGADGVLLRQLVNGASGEIIERCIEY